MAKTRASLPRPYLYVITLLLMGVATGRTKYAEYPNSKEGVWYPNGCVTMLGRDDDVLLTPITPTICQPIRITALGTMTYNKLDPNSSAEVARLEFSNGGGYFMTAKLYAFGRGEYSQSDVSKMSRMWRGVRNFGRPAAQLIMFFVAITCGFFFLSLFWLVGRIFR